jgi:hypothetical protein
MLKQTLQTTGVDNRYKASVFTVEPVACGDLSKKPNKSVSEWILKALE